jgi:hypothetical protein
MKKLLLVTAIILGQSGAYANQKNAAEVVVRSSVPVMTTCKRINNTFFVRCCDYNEDGQKLYCWTE